MKNCAIFRRIYDFEKKKFTCHQDSLTDYVLLILIIAQKILDESSAIETLDMDKVDESYLYLSINKRARANIYIANNKYVSLSFPFNIKKNGSQIKLYINKIQSEIDNRFISECISIINQLQDNSSFIDVWMEMDEPYNEETLIIVERLLRTEPCYLRYDYALDSAVGGIHPAIHLDINMSKIGHIKLGLYNQLTFRQFLDMLNPDTNCYYVATLMKEFQKKTIKFKKNKRAKSKKFF